jgi:hypothetical protein
MRVTEARVVPTLRKQLKFFDARRTQAQHLPQQRLRPLHRALNRKSYNGLPMAGALGAPKRRDT